MLKATVIIRKDATDIITSKSIKLHCSKHLAMYKIPSVYELKQELTISATGKKIKNN
jgi:acyl-CoA synthetase (AMP-forming)/AMP-acid ligase II